jgi:hypothetical protein
MPDADLNSSLSRHHGQSLPSSERAGYLARSVFDRGERQALSLRLCGDGLKNWLLVSGARRPACSLFSFYTTTVNLPSTRSRV